MVSSTHLGDRSRHATSLAHELGHREGCSSPPLSSPPYFLFTTSFLFDPRRSRRWPSTRSGEAAFGLGPHLHRGIVVHLSIFSAKDAIPQSQLCNLNPNRNMESESYCSYLCTAFLFSLPFNGTFFFLQPASVHANYLRFKFNFAAL